MYLLWLRLCLDCFVIVLKTWQVDLNHSVIIGTPKRLAEVLSCSNHVGSDVKYIILDEVDKASR